MKNKKIQNISEMYIEGSIKKYLDELASRAATPGGGSVSALVAALASSLIGMVANFTMGKEKYKEVEEEIKDILSREETLRKELCRLVEEDTLVYTKVSQSYRLPKETEAEKEKRAASIQDALKEASEVPLNIVRISFELLEISSRLVDIGNPNLITDTGIAALFAQSALEAAKLNVEINLAGIKDEEFVQRTRKILASLPEKSEEIKKLVKAKVEIQIKR